MVDIEYINVFLASRVLLQGKPVVHLELGLQEAETCSGPPNQWILLGAGFLEEQMAPGSQMLWTHLSTKVLDLMNLLRILLLLLCQNQSACIHLRMQLGGVLPPGELSYLAAGPQGHQQKS